MSLEVNDIEQIKIDRLANDTFINTLRNSIDELIKNDESLIRNGSIAPGVWEAKWKLDKSSDKYGYDMGYAVWINTESARSILNSRYNTVLKYAQQCDAEGYARIDKQNQKELNNFLINLIQTGGKNHDYFFFLGDLSQPAQIRISKKDENIDTPDTLSSWQDFYFDNSVSANRQMALSCLSDLINTQMSNHIREYHLSSISDKELANFVHKDLSSDLSSIKTQGFYDHTYCNEMNGFDYVIDSKFSKSRDKKQWYRLWNSGYLECGGTITVISGLNNINFRDIYNKAPIYNYSIGANGYEKGFSKLNGNQSVKTEININNRYSISVTPIADNGLSAYQSEKPNCSKNTTYSCVDITNIKNSGFSVYNGNPNIKQISYHTYGYKVLSF